MIRRLLQRLRQRSRTNESSRPFRLEALEPRILLAAQVVVPIEDVSLGADDQSAAIELTEHFEDPTIDGTVVLFDTVPIAVDDDGDDQIDRFVQDFYAELYDSIVPETVANFLRYVESGAYTKGLVHRSIPGFVIQGGAYTGGEFPVREVSTDAPTANEFARHAIVSGANAFVTTGVATVRLPAGTDLSGVSSGDRIRLIGRTDGLVDPSNSSRRLDFFDILSVNDGADTVVVSSTPTSSEDGIDWFIVPDVNVAGTLSPPKLGGDPDSATSGFFVNLANNADNLDIQNEGFAAFGKILLDGLRVPEAIASLPRVNANDPPESGPFGTLPLNNFELRLETPDDLVLLESIRVVDELSYRIVNPGDPSIAEVELDGSKLVVSNPGRPGEMNVVIRATDIAGQSIDTSFSVRVRTVASASQRVSFDIGGVGVLVAMSGAGQAEVSVAGTHLVLELTGTDETTALKLGSKGGNVTIRSLTADGALSSIKAKTGILDGDVTVAGSAGSILLKNDLGKENTITIGAPADPSTVLSIRFLGDANDLSIISETPIRSIKAARWSDAHGAPARIEAPSIGSIVVKGDFDVSLALDGSDGVELGLAKAKISGDVNLAEWDIARGAGKIDIRGAASDLVVLVDGGIAKVRAGSWASGQLMAARLASLTINGDFGAGLSLVGPADGAAIAKAIIKGTVLASNWAIHGDATKVVAAAFADEFHAVFSGTLSKVTSAGDSGGVFRAHAIGKIAIRGALTATSRFTAGFGFGADALPDTGDETVEGGPTASIGKIVVGGETPAQVVFEAGVFPRTASINRQKVAPLEDERFEVTPE